jgi:hypothetical protein
MWLGSLKAPWLLGFLCAIEQFFAQWRFVLCGGRAWMSLYW